MAISLKQAEQVIVHGPEQDCIVLVSPPGTGKSSIVVRAAQRMGAMYMPVYAATMEAVDARGLPYPENATEWETPEQRSNLKRVQWAAPSFLPLEMEMAKYKGRAVLVNFDDWFQAPPPVLRATVRSIYGDGGERRIGDFPVFKGARFVATGNREQDRAGVYRPETYVNDRITYIEVEPDADDWCSGAIGGFGKAAPDAGYAETRKAINRAVAEGVPDVLIAFVKWGKMVYDFTTEARSFLSPRSIERLGRFMKAFDAAQLKDDRLLMEVACGTIGDAQATKFMAFYKLRDELPDTDAILRGEDVPLPPRSEILYILCTAILRAAKKQHVDAVVKLINRLSTLEAKGMKVGVEVSAYLFRECYAGHNPELLGVRARPETMKWIQRHGRYFTE